MWEHGVESSSRQGPTGVAGTREGNSLPTTVSLESPARPTGRWRKAIFRAYVHEGCAALTHLSNKALLQVAMDQVEAPIIIWLV